MSLETAKDKQNGGSDCEIQRSCLEAALTHCISGQFSKVYNIHVIELYKVMANMLTNGLLSLEQHQLPFNEDQYKILNMLLNPEKPVALIPHSHWLFS